MGKGVLPATFRVHPSPMLCSNCRTRSCARDTNGNHQDDDDNNNDYKSSRGEHTV